MRLNLLLLVCGWMAMAAVGEGAEDGSSPARFELRDGDSVVLLGSTLIEREQKFGHWETMLTARYPDRTVAFRNLGWDGDTVWADSRGIFDPPAAGYARMIAQIQEIKPTVVFLGYGNNEAYAGKEGLDAFLKQYEKLLDDLTKSSAAGVRFVLLSPTRLQAFSPRHPDPAATNAKLGEYRDAIRQLAAKRGAWFVDLFDPKYSPDPKEVAATAGSLTENGVNISDAGYARLGFALSQQLGFHLKTPVLVVSGDDRTIDGTRARIEQPAVSADRITFGAMLDSLYVAADERHPESFRFGPHVQVEDVKEGLWSLKVDGTELVRARDDAWESRRVRCKPLTHPDAAQAEQLRQAIVAKNELYFHAWRPQNVTYLFGFRKHEQGQNAKETKEFEKLVAEKEAEIARLKKPVARKYELTRESD